MAKAKQVESAPVEMTSGEVIEAQGDSVLFEWRDANDMPQRHWLPKSTIVSDASDDKTSVNPGEGIPYGYDWIAHVGALTMTGEAFQRALRERGLWTVEDVRSNWGAVLSAMQAAYGYSLAEFLAALPAK